MTDNSRNSLAKLISQVKQLQLVEQLLSRSEGATVDDISQQAGCSTRHARRLIGALKELGCTIADDFVLGTRDAATFRMKKGSQLFKRP